MDASVPDTAQDEYWSQIREGHDLPLAVVVLDLGNSSDLTAAFPPEIAHEAKNQFRQAVEDAATRRNAYPKRDYGGDSTALFFRSPSEGLSAALDILEDCPGVSARVQRDSLATRDAAIPRGFRIGMAWGQVHFSHEPGRCTGRAIDIAGHIMKAAPDPGLLVAKSLFDEHFLKIEQGHFQAVGPKIEHCGQFIETMAWKGNSPFSAAQNSVDTHTDGHGDLPAQPERTCNFETRGPEVTEEVELVLDRDFDTFTPDDQQKLLGAIRHLLSSDAGVRITKIGRGSVKLTLEMSSAQARKLLSKSKELEDLGVEDVHVPAEEGAHAPITLDSTKHTLVDFLDSSTGELFEKAERFGCFLADWQARGTYSYHRELVSSLGTRTRVRDPISGKVRELVVLTGNNYLGLATRSETIAASKKATDVYGTAMCGSRFLSGTYDLIVELERQLAAFERKESAVVFSTGYQANVGTISALLRPRDVALIDRLCHASIVDGCRLSGAPFRTFKHNDVNDLERLLTRLGPRHRGKFIIVDGVFSMDGDLANLPGIVDLAHKHGARVMVDEAHGTGVVGATGRGAAEQFGICDQVDVVMGTCSKALACVGGFIASSTQVTDYVRHYGRSYMFSASPTPATVATVLAALHLIESEPGLRKKLWRNVRYFHARLKEAGFEVFPDPPQSAIMTIVIGPDTAVRRLSKAVYEKGLFVSTVAYPSVPRDASRLRISLSAAHSREDLDEALRILTDVGREHELI